MEVLVALAAAQGAVVSRQEMIERCWSGRAVSEDAIERCIGKLRKLAERASKSFTIETIPRVGYRLTLDPTGQAADGLPAALSWKRVRWPLTVLALATAAAVAAFYLMRTGEWTIVEMRPLVATMLIELHPAISPDGRSIAYSAGKDIYSRKIYIKKIEGGATVRLTDDSYDDTSPSWSADGARILYAGYRSGEPCHIMTIAASGGRAREVGRCMILERARVVFAPSDDAALIQDKAAIGAPTQIVRVDLRDGSRSVISHPSLGDSGDVDQTVAPDGGAIAYVRYSDRGNAIIVQDLQSGSERTVSRNSSWSEGLAWSEDGRSLFTDTNIGGDHAVWTIPLDAGMPQRLTGNSLYLGRLAGGRGGLLAAEAVSDVQTLAHTPSELGGQPYAVDPAHGQNWSPTSAPDGALALLSNRTGDNAVWLIKRGGSAAVASFGTNFPYHLRWSPDGSKLALELRSGGGGLSLRIIAANGTHIADIPASGSRLDAPSWNSDGQQLAIAAQDAKGWRIWRVDLKRAPRFEPASPYGWRAPQFHDGALLAARPDLPGIWLLNRDALPRLAVEGVRIGSPWMATGRSVVYVDRPDSAHPRFIEQTFDGAPARVLADATDYYVDLTAEYGGGFAIDPKLGGVTYVMRGKKDADIILMRLVRRAF
jgi:Tol biopolymer transport system component